MYREYFPTEKHFILNALNLFNNKKPASREEFFLGVVISFIYGMVFAFMAFLAFVMMVFVDEDGSVPIFSITGILIFLSFIPLFIITYRRLLDIDKSFLWLLLIIPLYFVPVINIFVLGYFLFKKGIYSEKYGPRNIKGEAIFYKYFIKSKPLFPQIKAFYLRKKGRLNRLPYFWGSLILVFVVNVVEFISFLFILFLDYFAKFSTFFRVENSDVIVNQNLIDEGGFFLYFIIFLYISLALLVFYLQNNLNIRRIHDLNYSGYYLILYYLSFGIPYLNILGIAFYLILLLKEGTMGDNKYGPSVVK